MPPEPVGEGVLEDVDGTGARPVESLEPLVGGRLEALLVASAGFVGGVDEGGMLSVIRAPRRLRRGASGLEVRAEEFRALEVRVLAKRRHPFRKSLGDPTANPMYTP